MRRGEENRMVSLEEETEQAQIESASLSHSNKYEEESVRRIALSTHIHTVRLLLFILVAIRMLLPFVHI